MKDVKNEILKYIDSKQEKKWSSDCVAVDRAEAYKKWDSVICSYGFPAGKEKNPIHDKPAALILLSKNIDDIEEKQKIIECLLSQSAHIHCTDCLSKLAVHCAISGLYEESYESIRLALLLKDLSSEDWTNIGAVFCDYSSVPEFAMACFEFAHELNQTLLQPKVNIWYAAHWLMLKLVFKKEFKEACEVGSKADKVGGGFQPKDSANTFALWGMALEGNGKYSEALNRYNFSLELDEDNYHASAGLRRNKISDPKKRLGDLNQAITMMALQAENMGTSWWQKPM
jgi:tetratricopeptide (TPR) repeat protein